MEPTTPSLPDDDVAAIDRLGAIYKELSAELSKIIIGQQRVVELLSIALFSRGHALLMGVPGLAKTLLISSVAKTLDLSFNRIQFTPDLMPADITGTDIIQDDSAGGKRQFEFIKGPVFANIVLADEINRAPAKTQSALLEAMQERRVTVMGRTFTLLPPFFVLATQNPIEQEGTYPLPEAQLDRFMFLIEVDYPTEEEEMRIARETTGNRSEELKHVLSGEEIIFYQDLVRRVPVPEHIYEYAVKLVRATRPSLETSPEWVKQYVAWGAGPRAVQFLILGAKTRAALQGSYIVRKEDIDAIVEPVLMHRVVTNFAAESRASRPARPWRAWRRKCDRSGVIHPLFLPSHEVPEPRPAQPPGESSPGSAPQHDGERIRPPQERQPRLLRGVRGVPQVRFRG
ncbi:AAA family ATPase [Akkermansia sp. EB-AMDK43]|nr:AAA family ATPase [Akkermansia sp. EB-AMDK43]WMX38015.1 AAA family ATPase [Akkermansia sp. EB-AMDK43]